MTKVRHTDGMQIRREVLPGLRLLPFQPLQSVVAGELRAWLESRGETVGLIDTMIAATALSADLVLVTGNVRHHARIPRLRVENWLEG